jgi:hypothetical protein
VDTNSRRRRSDAAAVLVVGATGILRPAVERLLHDSRPVLAVARNQDELELLRVPGGPETLTTLAYDAKRDQFVDALTEQMRVGGVTLSDALIYRPATTADVVQRVTPLVTGMTLELLPSAYAKPTGEDAWTVDDLPTAYDRHARLVLGWKRIDGVSTWHTAEEISAAALRQLAQPSDRVLGVVSPWADRPV